MENSGKIEINPQSPKKFLADVKTVKKEMYYTFIRSA